MIIHNIPKLSQQEIDIQCISKRKEIDDYFNSIKSIEEKDKQIMKENKTQTKTKTKTKIDSYYIKWIEEYIEFLYRDNSLLLNLDISGPYEQFFEKLYVQKLKMISKGGFFTSYL